MTPQMVPSALNNVKMAARMFTGLPSKYSGMSGMPNQPVERRPENASVINRYRARLW